MPGGPYVVGSRYGDDDTGYGVLVAIVPVPKPEDGDEEVEDDTEAVTGLPDVTEDAPVLREEGT